MRTWLLVILSLLAAPTATEPSRIIHVEMREFAFHPSTIRLPANRRVRLVLTNRGELAHQLYAPFLRRTSAVVTDESVHIETVGLDIVRLQPGSSATIEFRPGAPGRYPFACTIEGHKEAGMVGVLEVR